MGVMLKRLYIHNFKSFWKSEFEFGKVNCLIAPNNAGKSNLVEALELLDNILKKDLSKAFTLKQNSENYRYEEEEIVIKATFFSNNIALIANNLIKYKIETDINIKLNLKKFNFDIWVENIGKIKSVLVDSNDIKRDNFIIRKYNEDINLNRYEEYIQKLDNETFIELDGIEHPLFDILVGLKEINKSNFHQSIQNILGTDKLMASFYFHPQVIKYMQKYETDSLLNDGTNLAYFLNILDFETFENISTSLIGEVEFIDSIEISDGAVPHILFNENIDKKNNKIIHQKVSDGTIHFLTLMTALYADKSEILIFEEPERHMHIKALSYILNTMRDSNKQIFFTTHSGEFLKILKQDEIIFLYRDEDTGDTKGLNASKIELLDKVFTKHKYELSDIVRDEVLGYIGDYNV